MVVRVISVSGVIGANRVAALTEKYGIRLSVCVSVSVRVSMSM